MRVVLAGGGTAGHVEPALATADALRRLDDSTEITFLGTASGLEVRLVPARGYVLELIPRVAVPRRPTLRLLTLPATLAGAVRAAGAVLDAVEAEVVVGFGGYVSAPAYLAARRRGIPIVVHEANSRPGLANRLGARFASAVATAWPGSTLPRAQVVGMPLRQSIGTLQRADARATGRAAFDLEVDRPTLLVFGGSQGARTLNEASLGAADTAAALGVQVLHVGGKATAGLPTPARDGDQPAYRLVDYVDRMDLAYAAADLALCRAGAMTCAELAAVGLPAFFVPLPHGNGEQRLNAMPVVAAGGAAMVSDAECTAAFVASDVLPLAADAARLTQMSAAASGFGQRDGDVRLAALVLATGAGTAARSRKART